MPAAPTLSAREIEVVALIVEGLTNAEIADRLGLSKRTVQAHVSRLMARTETRSRTALAVFVLRAGILPLHPEARGD